MKLKFEDKLTITRPYNEDTNKQEYLKNSMFKKVLYKLNHKTIQNLWNRKF